MQNTDLDHLLVANHRKAAEGPIGSFRQASTLSRVRESLRTPNITETGAELTRNQFKSFKQVVLSTRRWQIYESTNSTSTILV